MIYNNIENIINNNNFVTAIGLDTSTLCNGYIGTFPKNPIMYEAIKYAYNVDVNEFMNNYSLLCKNLYNIIHQTTYNFKIKLYKEYDNKIGESAKVIDDNGNIIMIHYYKYKIIPLLGIENNTKSIVIGSSETSVKIIILNQNYNNPKFKLNEHTYDDKFDFEIHNNILIVKRIDSNYGWDHNHIVDVIEDN
jgi:hypothetical protein